MPDRFEVSVARDEADILGLLASFDPGSQSGDGATRRMLEEIVSEPQNGGLSVEVLEMIKAALG